jgi:hypothetical protein
VLYELAEVAQLDGGQAVSLKAPAPTLDAAEALLLELGLLAQR